MEPPEKNPGPAAPPGMPGGPGGGLPGLPMFGQNFSSHFLSGLQTFASQELVNKLQKINSTAQFPDFAEMENKEEPEPHHLMMDPQEEKIYTDELKQMCEYTCQICGKIMNAYYLRKHVRDHNMSMTTYKELYGKVQFTKLSFHRCRICQNVIKANYITIMKHLKCVHNVTFKDYKKKFGIFIGKESKQMFKEDEDINQDITDRVYSDKANEMCKVFCKVCNIEFPTHQFRFHVKSKHKINFDEYRDKHGTLELHNRVYHRCKVCFKVLLFQYEKLASHVTDSHGIKMSAYVRLYLERTPKVSKNPKLPKGPRKKREKKNKPKTKAKLKAYPEGEGKEEEEEKEEKEEKKKKEKPKSRMRTRGAVKEEEGIEVDRFVIKRELEEILMNQEIGEVEDSEEETRRSRRKKPRKKITRFRRRPKDEQMDIADIKTEVVPMENEDGYNDEEGPSVSGVKLEPGQGDQTNRQENGEATENQEAGEESTSKECDEDEKMEEDTKEEKKVEKKEKMNEIVPAVKSETAQAEMVFSDDPDEMCLCQCSFCDKVVPYDLLRKHVTSKHGKVKDDYGEYKYIRLTYHRCKKCNLEILFSYNNIKLHLNRFHKLSINEYQQSMQGFSGKIVSIRALKAMYDEEDGLKDSKRMRPMQSALNDKMLSSYMDPSDRSYNSLVSPEKKIRRDEERGWFDGNTFSCRESCAFATFSLDRFEDHVRMDHHTTIDAFKGRYHSTGVTLQCEYCGDSIYHELRSLQHHLDSHYLTLDQYQSHYLRSKGDMVGQVEAVPAKLDVHPTFNPPSASRIQQVPLPETPSLTQAFSETSALLDHLKRSELFRSSIDKTETNNEFHNHENFRSQESAGVGFPAAQDHFRPFDDTSAAAARVGGDFDPSYGRPLEQGLDLGRAARGGSVIDHDRVLDEGRGQVQDPRDQLMEHQHQARAQVVEQERSLIPDQGRSHIPEQGRSHIPDQGRSHILEQGRSHIPDQGRSHISLNHERGGHLLDHQGRSQILEARSNLMDHQDRGLLDQGRGGLDQGRGGLDQGRGGLDQGQSEVLDLGRDQFSSPRSFPAAAPGLPIDYSQHVQHRAATDIGGHRGPAPDSYKQQQQPTYLPELPKHDAYDTKSDAYLGKSEAFAARSDIGGYPPKSDIFLPKAPDLYQSVSSPAARIDTYSPKPETKMSVEDQKNQQENYFRYVTSQIHEYYNRRQGTGGVPVEAAAAAVYGRENPPPRPEAFEQDFARQENFLPGNSVPRGDMFGYRRENF